MAFAVESGRRTARMLVFVGLALAFVACKERSHGDAPAPKPSSSTAPTATATAPRAAGGATSSRPIAFDAAPPAPVVPVTDWVWKTYRGDAFTALFPGEPRLTELPPEDDKAGFTEASLHMPGGQVSFAVGFTESPADEVETPDELLDERANPPRRGETEVLYKRSITLAGHPGRVLILRRDISGTPLRVYSRLYLVGRRLYSLIVSTLDVGGVSEDVVKKFMDSFKLS
jgi:hypothetical protein